MLREKSTSLEITNCCNKGKQSLPPSSFIFLLHSCNFFLKAEIFSTNFKMCMLPSCRERFNAFNCSKIHTSMLVLSKNLFPRGVWHIRVFPLQEKCTFPAVIQTYGTIHCHKRAIVRGSSTTKMCIQLPHPHTIF